MLFSDFSPVIKAMMTYNTKEKETKMIDVDFDPNVFNDMVAFIHHGKSLDLNRKNFNYVFELYKIADYYHIESIQRETVLILEIQKSEKTILNMMTSFANDGYTEVDDFMRGLFMSGAS